MKIMKIFDHGGVTFKQREVLDWDIGNPTPRFKWNT